MSKQSGNVSYEDAGVSVERGNALIDRIKHSAAATHSNAVIGGLGGFGALFDFASLGYREPVLVSGTDGVGTKIKLAIETNQHDRIGIDLVAMCVNDLLVQGARPLFFLDYFACAKLDVDTAETVIKGIAKGCELAACALVGGETAEMPGMYADNDYDLAGFCVGAVEKSEIIDGSKINTGDAVLALASSGPHSNGYSLIRKLITDNHVDLDTVLDGKPLIDHLLEPTRIYVTTLLNLMQRIPIHGLAHITGGGLTENIPRVLPDGLAVAIDTESWQLPQIFQWLQQQGNITGEEMYRTFNCGVGMVVIVPAEQADSSMQMLIESGAECWKLGEICQQGNASARVIYR